MNVDRNVISVEVKTTERDLQIDINGLLHARIDRKRIVGLSTWINSRGRTVPAYVIEFVTDTNPVTLDYDRRDLWESILQKLAELQMIFDEMVPPP